MSSNSVIKCLFTGYLACNRHAPTINLRRDRLAYGKCSRRSQISTGMESLNNGRKEKADMRERMVGCYLFKIGWTMSLKFPYTSKMQNGDSMICCTLSCKEVTNSKLSTKHQLFLNMLFTTIQTKFRESSSELFKDRGASGDAPCPIGKSKVFALAPQSDPAECWISRNLCSILHTVSLEGNPVMIDEFPDISGVRDFVAPIATPQIGVNFKSNNNKEEVTTEMSVLGFSKVASGNNNYYLGGSSKAALKRITSLGGDVDSFTAPQHANIRGYMCFQFVAFILFNFCKIPTDLSDYVFYQTEDRIVEEATKTITTGMWYSSFVPEDNKVTAKNAPGGHFLPYFNGMNIPDLETLPRIMLTYFSGFFHTDAARTTLMKGFSSLASTSAGIQLSHLAVAVERGIILNAVTRVFITSGSIYSGAVIETDEPMYKGNAKHIALTAQEIRDELANFDGHDAALASVCSILSAKLTISSEKKELIVPNELTSPRQLHDLCRDRSFDADGIKELSGFVAKLSFTQTFWNCTDVSAIQRLITAIGKREFLPSDCPFPYKSPILFTKDIYNSTLAAFGDRVPTISSRGETLVSIPDKSETMFMRNNTARLPGVPIYEGRLNVAADNWREVFKLGAISMACNEKGKILNIKNVKAIANKDTDSGIALIRTLCTYCSVKGQERIEKRKKRDDADDEEEERIRKKREASGKKKAEATFDDFFF